MSKTAKTEARKMKPVSGLEGAGVEFIRPSKLEGPCTLVTEALYLGSSPNNFDNDKSDYKFETEDGKTIVLNGAGNLTYQMAKVAVNSIVTVEYRGKQEIKKGPMKGKQSHNFEVLTAAE
jgi:hypothetical protein